MPLASARFRHVSRWVLTVVAVAGAGVASLGAAAKSNADLVTSLKQKALQEAVGALLDQQLPLKLDASTLYPSVDQLPGGPFQPQRLLVTSTTWDHPLPPGDYVVRAVAFCSEYSVHRPGAGLAYQVGPVQGRAAEAIKALLWRGTLVKPKRTRDLQLTSWAIQSGVTYPKLPAKFQAIVDDLIPEHRLRLGGDFAQNLQDLYEARAKDAGLPPLEKFLTQLGKPGELVLAANRQRALLLKQNTSDQLREQVLYAGQERRIAPVKPAEGPWTERIPGVAYVRYRVVGGSQAHNNEIQIRVLPPPEAKVGLIAAPTRTAFGAVAADRMQVAAVAPPKKAGPSLYDIVHDGIGYAVSRAAQILYMVPSPFPSSSPAAVGKIAEMDGTASRKRDGEVQPLGPNDEIKMGDIISTGDGRMVILFADNSTISMSPNSTVAIDHYAYDPANGDLDGSAFDWLQGAFVYTSGLINKDKPQDINTPVGGIGRRGTEFIARYLPEKETVDIKLIAGSLLLSPKATGTSTLVTAPVSVTFTKDSVTTAPLSRRAYDGLKRPYILIR